MFSKASARDSAQRQDERQKPLQQQHNHHQSHEQDLQQRLQIQLQHMQKELTKIELESLEHKEDVLYYIRDGFGEVLTCIHDIVGPDEYSRLCD